MPDHTRFAGLTQIEPGDSVQDDNGTFLWRNPAVTDALLRLGAVGHRHNARPGLANPTVQPVVTVIPTGGDIGTDQDIYVGYTLYDVNFGETLMCEPVLITTSGGIASPTSAPSASADTLAGSLMPGNYTYGVTITDPDRGETEISPYVTATIDPGFSSAEVTVFGLASLLSDSGGTTWRLWRSVNGSVWYFVTEGVTDTFLDDGSVTGDCTIEPPDSDTTGGTISLSVTVPGQSGAGSSGSALLFSVYASPDTDFNSPCLLGTYTASSGATTIVYTTLQATEGQPPPVSLAWPGANLIDPDTELIDWHWKRPVATEAALPATGNGLGDVRATIDTRTFYLWDGAAWDPFASLTPGHVVQDEGASMTQRSKLDFVGVGVRVTDNGSDTTIVHVDDEARIPIGGSGMASAGVFGSGWGQSSGFASPAVAFFRDVSAMVCLEGCASPISSPTPGDVILTLPLPGYGPPGLEPFCVVTGDDTHHRVPGSVDVDSSGNVRWQSGANGTNPWVSLNGIRFRP